MRAKRRADACIDASCECIHNEGRCEACKQMRECVSRELLVRAQSGLVSARTCDI